MRDTTNDFNDEEEDLEKFNNHICKTMPAHDIVTCMAFDPSTGTQFAVGTWDNYVRIYDMVTNRVVDALRLSYYPTSLCFLDDRKTIIIGSHHGNCEFYSTNNEHRPLDSLKCSNTNVSLNSGSFVRSIECIKTPLGESKFLTSTNDSRIRLWGSNRLLERKYKGHKSKKLPLKHSYYA